MKIVVFYLAKLIWPIDLSPDYPLRSFSAITNVLSFVILAILLIAACWQFRRIPVGFFGLSFLFITLLPVSNLVPLFRPIADRYLYLPSIGWCLFLVSTLRYILLRVMLLPSASTGGNGKGIRSKKRGGTNPALGFRQFLPKGVILLFCTYLTILSVITIKQNRVWKDSLSLWSYTVKSNPTSSNALNNLAYAHLDAGKNEKALMVWEEFLVKFGEKEPDALAGMAIALYRSGRQREALFRLRKAISLDPSYGTAESLRASHFWNPDWIRDVERLIKEPRYTH